MTIHIGDLEVERIGDTIIVRQNNKAVSGHWHDMRQLAHVIVGMTEKRR